MADVLFVCVHNAGRSQMAKAIFNQLAKENGLPYRAESAGTDATGQVHPVVVTAMKEIGIDLSGAKPQLLTNEMVLEAKRVFTMGCAVDSRKCPAITIKRAIDWGLPDPKGRPLEEVRVIRDSIKSLVTPLLTQL